MLKGTGVSHGIGMASALVFHFPIEYDYIPRTTSQPHVEHKRLETALEALLQKNEKLREKTQRRFGEAEASIFVAYQMMLSDEISLLGPLKERLIQNNLSAEYAITLQFQYLADQFLEMDDEYLRQRSEDILNLRNQLLLELKGAKTIDLSHLGRPTVIIADSISPSDIANFDLSRVEGIICETGSYNSHASIIARTLGIPAVMGAAGIREKIESGNLVALDGESGEIWVCPTEYEITVLKQRTEEFSQQRRQAQYFRGKPTITTDGRRIELSATAGHIGEVEAALSADAESLGMFRSELMHNSLSEPPSEEQQFETYCTLLEKMNGKAATIRTFDSGKLYAPTNPHHHREINPVLGYRGIRMSLGRPSFFRTQLRAILRASAYGPLKIMFPMVSSVDELCEAKTALERVKEELSREGVPYDEKIPVGVLVSVPSAAIMADALAAHVNFFSINMVDLIQFTLAIDRTSPYLNYLFHHHHPSVLRFVYHTVQAAHRYKIPCNICGDSPNQKQMLPLLLGLGVDGFSMNPGMILAARQILNSCSYSDCTTLAQEVLAMHTSNDIAKRLSFLTI